MRDLFVTAVVFGSVPFILRWPYVGILMWCWLGFMNPHRLTWGFAYTMPFALIVAIATLVGLLFSREEKKIPWTRETILLAIFVVWMTITTLFATYPLFAWPQWDKVMKIQLMIFVTLILMQSKLRINLLVWVVTLSLAFYGIKGGIFTILRGGVYHVKGPPGSFIGDNNEIGLALIMTVPLLRYLSLTAPNFLLRQAMLVFMILTAIAAIGSLSRGALLGLLAMGTFLWLKSRKKIATGLLAAFAAVVIVQTMPPQWYVRMQTIKTFEQSDSALGRINAWKMAFNLAQDKPLGGGFETFRPPSFAAYAPEPWRVHDAHSIYFEILGEHGFVGLALFLGLGFFTWRTASSIIRRARRNPENAWAADLAAMVQVSLVGYGSAGAFLGLAYFDLYYTLIAIVVLTHQLLLRQERLAEANPVRAGPAHNLVPQPSRAA
jgi:probable O-glycosylation ligase (exosortase A-associated)